MKPYFAAVLAPLLLVALACKVQPVPAPSMPAATAVAPATAPASVPVAAVPAAVTDPNAVPDLPDYPGATPVAFSSKGPDDGWTKSMKRELTTTAPFADVRAYYQGAIASNGWTVTRVEDKVDEVEWKLTKGTSTGEVKVDAESGLPVVKVRLARKDR